MIPFARHLGQRFRSASPARVTRRRPHRSDIISGRVALSLRQGSGSHHAPPAGAQHLWLLLPPTPVLPEPDASGIAPVNGIRLWYAEFGHGAPVILAHGGLANSEYWGLQVAVLAAHYHVIVLDSRGHGRSTRADAPIGYDLMSSDVLALMDYLHIRKAALIGW